MRTKIEKDTRLRGIPAKVLTCNAWQSNEGNDVIGVMIASERGYVVEIYFDSQEERRDFIRQLENPQPAPWMKK
jgi:hypothetical protein